MATSESCSLDTVRSHVFSTKNEFSPAAHMNILFDQYKILVDNALRLAERFEASNNFFITTNGFIFSVIGFFINDLGLEKAITSKALVAILLFVGFSLTLSWMRVIDSYKKTSVINYLLTRVIEEKLPTTVFTFKFFSESEQKTKSRSNPVIYIESIIPRLFILAYLAISIMEGFFWLIK